jgi:hypothetical protein
MSGKSGSELYCAGEMPSGDLEKCGCIAVEDSSGGGEDEEEDEEEDEDVAAEGEDSEERSPRCGVN